MYRFHFLIFVFTFCIVLSSNGQIIEGAKRAVKKAEQKVAEKAVEKTFNGIVDKLFGKDTSSVKTTETIDSTDSSSSSVLGGLFKSKPVEKNFDFDITLDMEIITKEEDGEENTIATLVHYPMDAAYVGTEMENILNIMDFEEMMNYSVVGGNVTVMNLQSVIDKANKMAKDDKTKTDDEEIPEFRKTGKKEIIAGFECEEYEIKDKDFIGNYWVTQEIGVSPEAFSKAFATNPNFDIPDGMKGIVLKMIIQDLESESTTTMVTKSIKKEELSYDLSKYKATDLSRLKF